MRRRGARDAGLTLALATLLALGAAPLSAQDPDDPSPYSDAALVAEVASIQPGHPFTVALRLTMDEGWHSYWRNAGDAGSATIITWQLPAGFTAGEIQWPFPERIVDPPLVSYGYSGEVLLLVDITPPAQLTWSRAELRATADWVVCERICLPATADVQLDLPVRNRPNAPDEQWGARIATSRTRLPLASADWRLSASQTDSGYELHGTPPDGWTGLLDGLYFFATDAGVISYAALQPLSQDRGAFRLALTRSEFPVGAVSRLRGVAVLPEGTAWTEPVPTDFVLVAAGNLPDMQQIHPALRSRIRGGGYEVYVDDTMPDNPDNEDKLVQFVAQEIKKDGKIPHFTHEAVGEIIEQARKFAGRKHKFTLNLRELGGLVRAAGDVAREEKAELADVSHVEKAKKIFKSIEGQLGSKMIEQKKEYQTILTSGSSVGRVNGLAVLGASMAGLVLPIVADITPAASRSEGKVIATGKLGQIAKEAVENVSAIIKKHIGTDIAKMDIHIQFLQTYEGLEGDSASISTAVAVISAMADIPVMQDVAMTGSLDVRGGVLPVGGVTAKIEAAIDTGMKKVLVPKSNIEDVYLGNGKSKKIKIIPVNNIVEVLEHSLAECKGKKKLIAKISKQFK